jgi:iron complex outermembrane receptor protein
MHGITGADEVDSKVKKLAVDNTREQIVTLPTVKVKTEKKSAGYRADSTRRLSENRLIYCGRA